MDFNKILDWVKDNWASIVAFVDKLYFALKGAMTK